MTNGHEKSVPNIVAVKPTNKAGRPGAESGEPRARDEGNAQQTGTLRTQSREGASHGLERVRKTARTGKREKFTALLRHIAVELPDEAFFDLIDGHHHTNEVFLDNVRVPVANRIDAENRGWDCGPPAVDSILNVVLHGAFCCSIAAGRRGIAEKRRGTLLSIVSAAANSGRAFTVPSAAAKAGVAALMKSLPVEWGPHGIRALSSRRACSHQRRLKRRISRPEMAPDG